MKMKSKGKSLKNVLPENSNFKTFLALPPVRKPTDKEKLLQKLILHDWKIIDKKLREKVEDGTETQLSALHSYLKSAMDLVKV